MIDLNKKPSGYKQKKGNKMKKVKQEKPDIGKLITQLLGNDTKNPLTGDEVFSVLIHFSIHHHTNLRNNISDYYDLEKDGPEELFKALAKEEGIEDVYDCKIIFYDPENHDTVVVKGCHRIIDVPFKDIVQFMQDSEDNNSLVSSYLYRIPILSYSVQDVFYHYNVLNYDKSELSA